MAGSKISKNKLTSKSIFINYKETLLALDFLCEPPVKTVTGRYQMKLDRVRKKGKSQKLLLSLAFPILIALLVLPSQSAGFVCGDANNDGSFGIGDLVFIVNLIFRPPPQSLPPPVPAAADVNNDGSINVGDAVVMVNFIFHQGISPVCPAYGTYIGDTGCKDQMKDVTSSNQECFEFDFTLGNQGSLSIWHVNAGFNCCPGDMNIVITIHNDTITIDETQVEGLCECLCLFDVEYGIGGLEPGIYSVIFYSPVLIPGDEPLQATIDLTEDNSGTICVERTHYPW